MRTLRVPTGHIIIIDGERGRQLECLSLGDYGKDVNLSERPVQHTELLPLTEKWVITISTQYGCSMSCNFCDVPRVGPGLNATFNDMVEQIDAAIALHPEIRGTKRLNVHFARMGEPTWNPHVLAVASALRDLARDRWFPYGSAHVHPVVSTMMPANNHRLREFIGRWLWLKNAYYGGEAGLQLSINSTDEGERMVMFGGRAMPLTHISSLMATMPNPVGRKYTLNFAVAGYTVDAERLRDLFPPSLFVCKLTPMHKTERATEAGIRTDGDYTTCEPYEDLARRLRAVGFDVLVFITSREEDEGRITCGNAILSGTTPLCEWREE